jgi:penicillin G amidase
VAEAVQRLGQWDFTFTTPTGIAQGYDAGRTPGSPPTQAQIADSVAATIYAVWRSRAVTHVIDDHLGGLPTPDDQHALTAVKHLLDTFSATHGVGASGIYFFATPGITDPAAARDYLILSSLRDALTLLAGPAFGAAFHESANQNDYRWDLLHRLVLAHPLGGTFSVPPAFGQFPAPLPGLAGLPVDGGYETVDAPTHPVCAADANGFMFGGGPARRFVANPAPGHTAAVSALPGGAAVGTYKDGSGHAGLAPREKLSGTFTGRTRASTRCRAPRLQAFDPSVASLSAKSRSKASMIRKPAR